MPRNVNFDEELRLHEDWAFFALLSGTTDAAFMGVETTVNRGHRAEREQVLLLAKSHIRCMEEIEGEWNRLAGATNNHVLGSEWSYACARTLHGESDLRIAIFSRGGRIVAIAPLCRDRRLEGRRRKNGLSYGPSARLPEMSTFASTPHSGLRRTGGRAPAVPPSCTMSGWDDISAYTAPSRRRRGTSAFPFRRIRKIETAEDCDPCTV